MSSNCFNTYQNRN